jgi:fermentation-respiration switch protein FrsA (DUF1100 family)
MAFSMVQLPSLKLSQRSLKRLIYGGLSGSIGVAGAIIAVSLYIVETLTRPKKYKSRIETYKFSPFELDLPAEEVFFPPEKGDYLVNGWFIPRPGATTTIVVCPGYRSDKADVIGISAHLWKAGHNILVFEYHGHGQEVGKPITLGYKEIHDFLGAVAYARERTPGTRIGVIAYSMGASVAIMGMARSSDIEALVSDSAFATHASAVDYNFRRIFHLPSPPVYWMTDYLLWRRAGYHFNQVEPIREIDKITPRPILIIQGGKDTIVNPQDATLLYKAAQEPKELWLLPNADHCGAYFDDRPAYVKKVTEFFDAHLKREPRLHLVDSGEQDSLPEAS